jgi:DNA-directed RNA polymerase specialized sigma24 family protein
VRNLRKELEKDNNLANQNISQLYRFCFLMLGDPTKAQEVFESMMHDAAIRAAQGELPKDRLWLFNDARWRSLEASEAGLQPEPVEMEEHEIAASAPSQIAQLDPTQLAIWISAAPDPQRSALALYYLDEFNHEELLTLTDLKTPELAKLIGNARQEFQAWLNATVPPEPAEEP